MDFQVADLVRRRSTGARTTFTQHVPPELADHLAELVGIDDLSEGELSGKVLDVLGRRRLTGKRLSAVKCGCVTTRDARDSGVDPAQLRLLAARGRLERAGRGVYRVSILPRGEHDDLAAAVAWTLGRGTISHESALVLHALADVDPSRIHLTVPRDNHPRAAGGELYRLHRRDLNATDITSVDDIPVTTVTRTIKDCLDAGTDPYQLRAAIERTETAGTLRRSPASELRAALDEPAGEARARRNGESP